MQTKKGTGRDEVRSDKARLDAIRAQREQLINRIWRSEHAIERDRKLIAQLDDLIAKSKKKS